MLAARVLKYLRTQERWYPGNYYSELPIACSLHVGDSKVRDALDALADDGMIERRAGTYGVEFRAMEPASWSDLVSRLVAMFDAALDLPIGNVSIGLHCYDGAIVQALRAWASDRGLEVGRMLIRLSPKE